LKFEWYSHQKPTRYTIAKQTIKAMIYFMGDIHGRFDRVIDTVQRDRPDGIVLLGDMECDRPLHAILAPIRKLTAIWWIPGNHDVDRPELWVNLVESDLADRNLHGRVQVIAGMKVAGLGGVFRQEIWLPPKPANFNTFREYEKARLPPRRPRAEQGEGGKRLRHQSSIFPDVYADLMRQRADILVTHEAPSCHPHGFAAIDDLGKAMRVHKMFHGHHHDSLDYSAWSRQNGIDAFGVGLRGITNGDGVVVVPGEIDEQQRYREGR